jgi:hypothetical protein
MEIVTLRKSKTYTFVNPFDSTKEETTDVNLQVVEDFGMGFQPLSLKLTGGIRTVAGVITDLDKGVSENAFTLPTAFHPNFDSAFIALVIDGQELSSAIVSVRAASGATSITGPNSAAREPPKGQLSLSRSVFVPREVPGVTELTLESGWTVTEGLTAHSHVLNMDTEQAPLRSDHQATATLCVLSGAIETSSSWGAGNSKAMLKLDPQCVKGYADTYWMAASVTLDGVQQWITGDNTDYQFSLTEGNILALYAKKIPGPGQILTVSLDGVTFAARSVGNLPAVCEQQGSAVQRSSKVLGESSNGDRSRVCTMINRASAFNGCTPVTKLPVTPKISQSQVEPPRTQSTHPQSPPLPPEAAAVQSSCHVPKDAPNWVNTAAEDFATVVPADNLVVMGDSLHSRTCVLRGVVTFTRDSSDSLVAQLDPNLRDPTLNTPLCFPLNALLFMGGVTSGSKVHITQSVAVRIEPHGRLRITSRVEEVEEEKPNTLQVRLDGIIYHPFMRPNTAPTGPCAPYCFPESRANAEMMGAPTGCVKQCTPTSISFEHGQLNIQDCQCDMIKRLECFGSEHAPRCGQFKELIHMHHGAMTVNSTVCGQICARQLAVL